VSQSNARKHCNYEQVGKKSSDRIVIAVLGRIHIKSEEVRETVAKMRLRFWRSARLCQYAIKVTVGQY